jgi:hypothetical protein
MFMALTSACLSISSVASSASQLMKFSMLGGISFLVENCRRRWQKLAATHLIGVVLVLCYVYHFMIFLLFESHILLNLVNLVTVLLSSADMIISMYYMVNVNSGKKNRWYSELAVAGSYWEVILAGIVLLEMELQQLGF